MQIFFTVISFFPVIYSVNKYLRRICYILGSVLGMNKLRTVSFLKISQGWKTESQSIRIHTHCVLACSKSLQLCLTLCDPMDCSLPGSPVHGNSPGKNTGVDCPSLFQGIFLTQRSNPSLLRPLHCRHILYPGATREAHDTLYL